MNKSRAWSDREWGREANGKFLYSLLKTRVFNLLKEDFEMNFSVRKSYTKKEAPTIKLNTNERINPKLPQLKKPKTTLELLSVIELLIFDKDIFLKYFFRIDQLVPKLKKANEKTEMMRSIRIK